MVAMHEPRRAACAYVSRQPPQQTGEASPVPGAAFGTETRQHEQRASSLSVGQLGQPGGLCVLARHTVSSVICI